jgi:TM2 domain-containing membrane protein YozV
MYSIKAHDGRIYGPVDLAQVRQWIAEGRILPDTPLIDGVTNTEAPASYFPLIAPFFQAMTPPTAMNQGPYSQHQQPYQGGYQTPPGGMGSPYPGYNPYPGYARPGGPMPYYGPGAPRQKIIAGLLALFVGALGVHQFYLGKNGLGITMLLITVLTCGYGSIITGIWALVDAISIFMGSTTDVNGQALI